MRRSLATYRYGYSIDFRRLLICGAGGNDFCSTIRGGLIAAVLALLSIAALSGRSPTAIPNVWLSNHWGMADHVNANIKGVTQDSDVGLFGAGIYVPALFGPILLTAHVLAFRLLLKRSDAKVKNESSLAFDGASPKVRIS
jgi:hypothetical protein